MEAERLKAIDDARIEEERRKQLKALSDARAEADAAKRAEEKAAVEVAKRAVEEALTVIADLSGINFLNLTLVVHILFIRWL